MATDADLKVEAPAEQLAYSVSEAARVLGSTEGATRQRIQRGILPARRIGRRLVVLRADLEQYLQHLPRHDRGTAA